MLLKLVVLSLCALSCTAVFPRTRVFGNIVGSLVGKNRLIGASEVRRLPNAFRPNKVIVEFPKVRDEKNDFIIKSIKQFDLTKTAPKVKILEGGIGSKKVIMEVEGAPGAELNTAFDFYGKKIPRDSEKVSFLRKLFFPKVEKPVKLEPGVVKDVKNKIDFTQNYKN